MESRKKRKDGVYTIVAGPIILIGLYFFFNSNSTNYWILGGIILVGVIMGSIASSYVPDMRYKKNRNKNPYSGLPLKKRSRRKF